MTALEESPSLLHMTMFCTEGFIIAHRPTQANTRNPLPTKPVNKPHPQRAAEDRTCAGAVLYSPKGTGQQNNLTSPQEGSNTADQTSWRLRRPVRTSMAGPRKEVTAPTSAGKSLDIPQLEPYVSTPGHHFRGQQL
ncbi:hypothetical protein Y1Q_0008379 [Alligator mississippiensis]|uniref:Uncharacterized protein n=1 Tax=Alligator mississippiensis TaxID=8496 RepID=A0A151N1X8_ALLMI|nr:hypothetical protein Y1Q_0008379 [Alligator mississippiensis]